MITLLIAQVDDPSDREFLTWLFHEFHRLMFHTAQEYVSDQFEKDLRRTKTRNQHLYFVEDHDLFQNHTESSVSLDEYAALLEHREAVDHLWPKLSELDQYVLGSYYFVGLKTDEIAKTLGCSQDAVRMKLSRARKRAREILIKDGLIYE